MKERPQDSQSFVIHIKDTVRNSPLDSQLVATPPQKPLNLDLGMKGINIGL